MGHPAYDFFKNSFYRKMSFVRVVCYLIIRKKYIYLISLNLLRESEFGKIYTILGNFGHPVILQKNVFSKSYLKFNFEKKIYLFYFSKFTLGVRIWKITYNFRQFWDTLSEIGNIFSFTEKK